MFLFVIFFFKQKTAYEMRISDWSSDVCSSDLRGRRRDTAKASPAKASPCTCRTSAPIPDNSAAKRRLRSGASLDPATSTKWYSVPLRTRWSCRDDEIGRASCRESVCEYV